MAPSINTKIDCEICHHSLVIRCSFQTQDSLQHTKVHLERKRFECSECVQTCHRAENMRTHIRLKHRGTGRVLDNLDSALLDEMEAMAIRCFPSLKAKLGARIGTMRKKFNIAAERMKRNINPASSVVKKPVVDDEHLDEEDQDVFGIPDPDDGSALNIASDDIDDAPVLLLKKVPKKEEANAVTADYGFEHSDDALQVTSNVFMPPLPSKITISTFPKMETAEVDDDLNSPPDTPEEVSSSAELREQLHRRDLEIELLRGHNESLQQCKKVVAEHSAENEALRKTAIEKNRETEELRKALDESNMKLNVCESQINQLKMGLDKTTTVLGRFEELIDAKNCEIRRLIGTIDTKNEEITELKEGLDAKERENNNIQEIDSLKARENASIAYAKSLEDKVLKLRSELDARDDKIKKLIENHAAVTSSVNSPNDTEKDETIAKLRQTIGELEEKQKRLFSTIGECNFEMMELKQQMMRK